MKKRKWAVLGLAAILAITALPGEEQQAEAQAPVFSQPELTSQTSEPGTESVELPCVLGNAGVIVQQLAQYEGSFLENGGEEPVAGTAALVVYNPGKEGIHSARIRLEQGGKTLYFSFTFLPPGSKVLVLEENQAFWSPEPITACECISIAKGEVPSDERLLVEEADGMLAVQNITEDTISSAAIFYKSYDAGSELYVGGRTQVVRLEALEPGEVRKILPYGYAPGYSRVCWIITES